MGVLQRKPHIGDFLTTYIVRFCGFRHCQPLLTTVSPRIPYRVYLRGILVWWRTVVLTSRRSCYAGLTEFRNHGLLRYS